MDPFWWVETQFRLDSHNLGVPHTPAQLSDTFHMSYS
jgi:hypothetical protein